VETLWQDLRYALRALAKSPGFTTVAVLTLALGIGANTAIFSVLDKVLLQPLPYPDPDQLVQLEESYPDGATRQCSIPKVMLWREHTEIFKSVAAYELLGAAVNLTGEGEPQQLKSLPVSANYFSLFGAPFALGRPFSEAEDRPGGPKLAVISNSLWRTRFGASPAIVGKAIELNGELYGISGVLGPGFGPDSHPDIYLPLQIDPNSTDQANYLTAAARLRPGVTIERARAALKITAKDYKRRFPNTMDANSSFTVESLRQSITGDVRPALLVLAGAVAFVLLIACANVANLLLARATMRQREMSVRAALGAARGRLIRQLLTESVLLSLAAGVLGLFVGYFGVRTLLAVNPAKLPRIAANNSGITLDWTMLLFTFVASVSTGIVFGLIPALNASRSDLSLMLRGGLRSGVTVSQNKARSTLVIAEMALALVLLAGSALLIRTFIALRTVAAGFNPTNVLTMETSLKEARFSMTADVTQLVRNAQQRIEALPGIEAVAATCTLPLETTYELPFSIEGRIVAEGSSNGDVIWQGVSPGYFEVFRIPLIRGRLFTDRDDSSSDGVVLINEMMAKKFWPHSNPIGERITISKGLSPGLEDRAREIVGIVGDVRVRLDLEPMSTVYIPLAQRSDAMTAFQALIPLHWVVRTAFASYSLAPEIERELRVASGGLPVAEIRPMSQVESASTAQGDFNTVLLTIFAGLALLLAAIGIYGLMAYSVEQRTSEIGIRMALGASRRGVVSMVVRQGLRLAFIGVILGVIAALGMTRLMASMVYGVKTWDPLLLVAVVALLSAVAFAATYIPARRAARIDPVISLRYE
jgi:putative ABC transport system permease protein